MPGYFCQGKSCKSPRLRFSSCLCWYHQALLGKIDTPAQSPSIRMLMELELYIVFTMLLLPHEHQTESKLNMDTVVLFVSHRPQLRSIKNSKERIQSNILMKGKTH